MDKPKVCSYLCYLEMSNAAPYQRQGNEDNE
jgi:hypothetical protein